MNSFQILKSHIWIYRYFGLWPSNQPSFLYRLFSIIAIGFVYTGFPIMMLVSVLFVKNVNQAVDNLVMTSSLVMAGIKGVNIFLNRHRLQELFDMLDHLDKAITKEEERMFDQIFEESRILLKMFLVAYLSAWLCLTSQIFWSNKDQILWSSTLFYPYEPLQAPSIYFTVLVYQCFSNFCICVVDSSADTYGVVLNHVLGGHVDVLGKRLQELGHSESSKDSKQLNKEARDLLIQCVHTYTVCLRYSKLLENILSGALFLQFGVSGLVLCTCAFQLSVTSTSDIAKFSFIIVYFICMIIEIFVPCYYGSVVMEKSRQLTYNAFRANWLERGPLFAKSLQIFVERTFRPIATFAGGYFLLHLPVFLSIVRAAYSLFALLKNVQKE